MTLLEGLHGSMAEGSASGGSSCALATISRLLLEERPSMSELLGRVAGAVASAFGQPGSIAVRVAFDGHEALTDGFDRGHGRRSTEFTTAAGKAGAIEVVELGTAPRLEDSTPVDCRIWLDTVANMMRSCFECEAADQARGASESRLRQVTESMSDMVVQVDDEGRIRYISSLTMSYFGRPLEAVLGHEPSEFSHDQDRQALDCLIRAVLDGGATERLVLRVRKADGACVPIEAVGDPLRDDSGRIVGGTLFLGDLNARRQAEEAIRRREVGFRVLIENSPTPSPSSIPRGPSITRVHLSSDLGFTNAEMIGHSSFEYVHPEDAARSWRAAIRRGEPGNPVTVRYRFRHCDGSYRVWSRSATPRLGGSELASSSTPATSPIASSGRSLRKLSRAVEQSPSTVVITDVVGTSSSSIPNSPRSRDIVLTR